MGESRSRGGLGPGPLDLRKETRAWTPGSQEGDLGSGSLSLRRRAGVWTPGSEGGGLGPGPLGPQPSALLPRPVTCLCVE
jgi:hypothetical protein